MLDASPSVFEEHKAHFGNKQASTKPPQSFQSGPILRLTILLGQRQGTPWQEQTVMQDGRADTPQRMVGPDWCQWEMKLIQLEA